MVNLRVTLDPETNKAFRKKLIDDDLTVGKFIKLCIDMYLKGTLIKKQ